MLCIPRMLCRTLRRLRDCRKDLRMLCMRERWPWSWLAVGEKMMTVKEREREREREMHSFF